MNIELINLSRVKVGALISGLVFIVLAFFAVPFVQAESDTYNSSSRLITIHDNGVDRGVITEHDTLREVFKEANIPLDPNDMVEPGLDEKLVANNYQVNVYRARPVIIVDGSVEQRVMSAYQTPQQIAEHAGIKLQPEDTANVEVSTNLLRDGASLRMEIDRATPVNLVLYGNKDKIYTQSETVDQLLAEKGIELGDKDTLSVKRTADIKPQMKIEIWRNGKQTVTKDKTVAFEIEQIQDTDREIGYRKIKTPGELGKKTVTYEIVMKNGHEVSRKIIQTVVTQKPKKQVEIVGAKLANTFDGDFGQALAKLRSCEGSYTSNTGNGYYGAYQYDLQTWGNYKGYPNAAAAPPKVQDEKAWQTYQSRGWSPWPSCSNSQGLQDIYR